MRLPALFIMLISTSFLASKTAAFMSRTTRLAPLSTVRPLTSASSNTTSEGAPITTTTKRRQDNDDNIIPPWSYELLKDKKSKKRNSAVRVRQHVNPLARRFQLPTILSDDWPRDVYDTLETKPLFLDIGVGKGGFLLKLASQRPDDYNYLGLEIRPLAVQFANERLQKNPEYDACRGSLDFVGCNANVDLERLLCLYREASQEDFPLAFCSIQFPDPHFKASHAKRRVVTPELVIGLAKFMPPGATVFLQSDIQTVLDDMRERFREAPEYFQDQIEDLEEYHPENLIGVPTEREISVLNQDLPVYRSVFVRTEGLVE